jgi:hypothetical protein
MGQYPLNKMFTYIIRTINNEFYCGKTEDIEKRMKQHKAEKFPHWFYNDSRKNFKIIFCISGDYEKKIKSFGVSKFVDINRGFVGVLPHGATPPK